MAPTLGVGFESDHIATGSTLDHEPDDANGQVAVVGDVLAGIEFESLWDELAALEAPHGVGCHDTHAWLFGLRLGLLLLGDRRRIEVRGIVLGKDFSFSHSY